MITHFSALLHRYIRYTVSKSRLQMVQGVYREPKRETFLFIHITNTAAMNTIFKSLRSIILLIMLMLLMPFISFAADTIRVNIPRVTVTMARSYNFTSAANSVYVPVEFNSAMSADKVVDYIEESNAFLFDHYGEYVVERNDYYPLGMRTSTGNSYPQLTANLYKYNGKEVQTVGGLGFTDYGARMYDDFTGRWFVPDPLAEKYASMSPYMYCGGNPIMYFDKDGKIWDTLIDVGFLIYDVGSAIYYHATGEHETAKGYWVDAGIDAVAAVIPIASAGMTKLPKLIGKGSNAVAKSADISKTAKVIDKTSDVKKGLKNAEAIKEGKLFEQDELAKSIAEGKDVRGQITLVPLNGGGNVKGNRSRLDQLIRNDDNTYSVIETKLRHSTKLSPGQKKCGNM